MDKEYNKNFLGINIKKLRNSLGLTQEEFCSFINLEVPNLSKIENGKSLPSLQTLIKIIEKFNIEPNDLFNIRFYDKPEVVRELTINYFDKLPPSKQILILKILILINEKFVE